MAGQDVGTARGGVEIRDDGTLAVDEACGAGGRHDADGAHVGETAHVDAMRDGAARVERTLDGMTGDDTTGGMTCGGARVGGAIPFDGTTRDGSGDDGRPARLERMAAAYRDDRRERGPRVADREWVDRAIDDWLDNLRGGRRRLRRRSADALTVGMAETLAVRDALLVSLVTGRDGLDKAVLMDFACRPHAPHVCGRMGGMLSGEFRDPDGRPDRTRCRRGVAMLEDMAACAPDRFRVQPLTAVAYVLWWNGDDAAACYAMRALALDGGCSLAAIVLGALRRGMYPAWHGR